MLNLYRSSTGEHVAAEHLTPAEAVEAFRSGTLLAVDFPRPSRDARSAVHGLVARAPARVVIDMRGVA